LLYQVRIALNVYEVSQADGTLSAIDSSPFTPVKQDSKTGWYGYSLDMSALDPGQYVCLVEATVDSIDTSWTGTFRIEPGYGTKVYVDADGTNSTVWPYGHSNYPTSTIANGKTIADANGLKALHLEGNLSFASTMEHYYFYGFGHVDTADLIDLNSQDLDHSSFENLILNGAQGGGGASTDQIRCVDCLIYAVTNLNATLIECGIGGNCSVVNGASSLWVDCTFRYVTDANITVQSPTRLDIINARGQLNLVGMTGGTVYIHGQNSLDLTIANTCSGGNIYVSGDCTITDNSNGTIVHDNTTVNGNNTLRKMLSWVVSRLAGV